MKFQTTVHFGPPFHWLECILSLKRVQINLTGIFTDENSLHHTEPNAFCVRNPLHVGQWHCAFDHCLLLCDPCITLFVLSCTCTHHSFSMSVCLIRLVMICPEDDGN